MLIFLINEAKTNVPCTLTILMPFQQYRIEIAQGKRLHINAYQGAISQITSPQITFSKSLSVTQQSNPSDSCIILTPNKESVNFNQRNSYKSKALEEY